MEVLKRRSCFQAIVKWGTLLVSLGWSVIHNSKLSAWILLILWWRAYMVYKTPFLLVLMSLSLQSRSPADLELNHRTVLGDSISSLWSFLPRFSSLLRLRCLLFGMGLCPCFCSKPVSYQPSTFCLSCSVNFSCTLCWFLSALSFRPSVS